MITIFTESGLRFTEFLKVPFSRLGSLGLQGSLQLKQSLFDILPRLLSQELVIGQNNWLSQPKVNTNNDINRFDFWSWNCKANIENPVTISKKHISSIYFMLYVLFSIGRNLESDGLSSCCGGHPDSSGLPINLESMKIVARRTEDRFGARYFLVFLFQSKGTFDCFSSFNTGLDMKITYKCRIFNLEGVIKFVVKSDTVFFFVLPSPRADSVKDFCEQETSFLESGSLNFGGFKDKLDCPLHKTTIPYVLTKVNHGEMRAEIPLSAKADSLLAA
jgi:hypothetical protein